jgi:hypothetical protein
MTKMTKAEYEEGKEALLHIYHGTNGRRFARLAHLVQPRSEEVRAIAEKDFWKAQYLRDLRRLAELEAEERTQRLRQERLEEVRTLQARLDRDGAIYVSVWGRDCDGFESWYASKLESVEAFFKLRREEHDKAEGPLSIRFLTEDEYEEFESGWRDRYAESMGY